MSVGGSRRAIVVGGSQAGLAARLALHQAGHDVVVLERSRRRLEDRGAGIYLHPALLQLLSERAGVDVASVGCTVRCHQFVGPDGGVVLTRPWSMTFTSWGALFALLSGSLDGTTYRAGAEVTGFEPDGDGVRVRLAGGEALAADLLVFADGVASTGRRLCAPESRSRYAGYVVWRGVVPEEELSQATRELLGDAHTTCLLDRSHMNLYPVPRYDSAGGDGPRAINFVWYRNAALGAELPRLLTDASGSLRNTSVPRGLVAEERVAELRRTAAAVLPAPAAEVVARTAQPYLQTIMDVEAERMAFGRACLIGDAACVARPHVGAGTAKAAENAWALADALTAADGDVPRALAAWEPGELALGRAVIDRSRRLGELLQGGGLSGPDDPRYEDLMRTPLRPADAHAR